VKKYFLIFTFFTIFLINSTVGQAQQYVTYRVQNQMIGSLDDEGIVSRWWRISGEVVALAGWTEEQVAQYIIAAFYLISYRVVWDAWSALFFTLPHEKRPYTLNFDNNLANKTGILRVIFTDIKSLAHD
jgi:hypothetical protein